MRRRKLEICTYGNKNVPEEFDWVTLGGGEAPEPIVRETQFSRRASAIAFAAAVKLPVVQMGLQNLDVSDADFQDLSDDEGKDSRKSIIGIGWEYMGRSKITSFTQKCTLNRAITFNAVVRLGGFDTEGIFRLAW